MYIFKSLEQFELTLPNHIVIYSKCTKYLQTNLYKYGKCTWRCQTKTF